MRAITTVFLAGLTVLSACSRDEPEPPRATAETAPQLGVINLSSNGRNAQWKTYDLGAGGKDTTAFVTRDRGALVLRMTGFRNDDPILTGFGRIVLEARFPDASAVTATVTRAAILEDSPIGAQYRNADPGEVTNFRVSPPQPGQTYGTASGTISTRVCGASADIGPTSLSDCENLQGTFSTKVSYEVNF